MSISIFHHFQYIFSPAFYAIPLTSVSFSAVTSAGLPDALQIALGGASTRQKTLPGEFLGTPLARTTVGLSWIRETRCRDIDGDPSRGHGRPSCGTSGRTDDDVYQYDCGWEVEAQVVVKYANVHYFTDARDEFAATEIIHLSDWGDLDVLECITFDAALQNDGRSRPFICGSDGARTPTRQRGVEVLRSLRQREDLAFAARLDPALLFHVCPPTSHSSEASPMTVMRVRASMGESTRIRLAWDRIGHAAAKGLT